MGSFIFGEYAYSIDNKGRIIIPPKFRDFLGDTFVITKGLDGCLFVFPQEEWINFEQKLGGLPITDKNARNFTRFFFASATECALDKQGRVMIPAVLREFAKLEKSARVVGVKSRIEIWSDERWMAYSEEDEADFADHMAALGI